MWGEHTWIMVKGHYYIFLYHSPLETSSFTELTGSAGVADQEVQDPPGSAPSLGLYMYAAEPGFFMMWVLGRGTQGLMLVQQALSHLPSPSVLHFYVAVCLTWLW